jgi:hypothetical protein
MATNHSSDVLCKLIGSLPIVLWRPDVAVVDKDVRFKLHTSHTLSTLPRASLLAGFNACNRGSRNLSLIAIEDFFKSK